MPRKQKEIPIVEKPFVKMDIVEETKRNFVIFANEANLHRAIAYQSPGFKPIVGHAIWAMWVNNRRHNKPYTKSAKVEGEVMSYSPHGGSYDALVRMAQDFIFHIPYIDGHGSFGSVIGGPTPGASRYTEMRLSEFTEDVLFYNTKLLDMGMNYLEEDPEPILDTWVALLPLMYISNTDGIGYTMTSTWSSGNLLEFRDQLLYYLKKGKVDCSKIFPDFPTGGVLINKSEMKDLYETGRGTIKLRGKVEIDGDTIKILSLPYQVYPEKFLEEVKAYYSSGTTTIKDVANRCGMDGFLIEIVCEPNTAEYTLEVLYRKTSLQTNISDIHRVVTKSGKPEVVSFYDYMKNFVDDNINLVKKEAKYNLDELKARLEIVIGLLNALDIIDEIIASIKKSKSMQDAKQTLATTEFKYKKKKITFTENQADAIVHTPLGRLANLEQIKLQEEKDDLDKQIEVNEDLYTNYKSQEKYFLKRFNKLVDKYGWERKTELADIEQVDLRVAVEKPERLKKKKEFMVVLSDNKFKRIDITKYRATSEDEKAIKVEGNQQVTFITNKGIMYKILSNTIDVCLPAAIGTEAKTLRPEMADDERILTIYSEDIDKPMVYFVTKCGLGKTLDMKNVIQLSKRVGAVVCGLKVDGDEVIAIKAIDKNDKIEITTNQRKQVIVPDAPQGRSGSGKRLLNLRKNETITEVHSC